MSMRWPVNARLLRQSLGSAMSRKSDRKFDLKSGFGFDPEWSAEQALNAGSDGPFSPFHRWASWKTLEYYQQRFKAGDKECLFSALHSCAAHNLPMPDWLADAYCAGFDTWVNYKVPSLDEAFDIKIPKGKHINRLKELHVLKISVALAVKNKHSEGQAIDQQLFADVGAELGIGGSKARDIYYNNNHLRDLQKKT